MLILRQLTLSGNVVMEEKKKKKIVDEATRRKAVQDYKLNGNASAIARKYGVARSTFLAWLPIYSNDFLCDNDIITDACVSAIEKTSEAVIQSIYSNNATRQQFLEEHYAEIGNAISANIRAISQRLKKPDNIPMRDLAASLNALSGIIKEFLPVEEQGSTTINLLQQTINNQ